MAGEPTVTLTIAFNDPELDNEELEAQAQNLLAQMRDLDEIETVDRVLDPNPPEGNKAIGGMLVGLLMAEVSVANFKKLGAFLGDRLGGKVIELEVEANGKKLKVKANSREELGAAIDAAQKFVAG
ncbi:hypothetical protein H6F86_28285 [Phormidium sp. FACHB-592]|uniref:Sugar ABC transporter permease n=1 Tax=Stenomitos frigidus AS-A4 TaxID=2933935 RepID=A0ABV0KCY4_9CYAN|nr:hypothetical protein [Phormidium sp. FACHB-592]MBD2077716.1 hypothetical protein [Phormidium sp. FACHB-592]